ncbi:hypothetical protein PAMA_018980 [Pampus argenteus]
MAAVQIPSTTKWQKSKVSPPCNHKPVLEEDRPVTPSVYTQEMLQSTEERLANTNKMYPPHILELLDMSKTTHHKLSLVDVDQALFQPYPPELVFQNFTPAQTYKLPLLLLNKDKVSRQMKLELQDSEYFSVVGPEEAGNKVAPGLSATFTVCFTPQESKVLEIGSKMKYEADEAAIRPVGKQRMGSFGRSKDYHHRLVCVTERERFEIPIRAIGPRAILDFRDELYLPVCPVKASTQRTQLVRNIGNGKAMFKLHTQRPFLVTPSSGTLDVGESMQVTVDFNPMTTGDHKQDLLLQYHTGEDVYISLYGACEELSIHLEPDSILLKNTYISLANVHKVSLTNSSDIPLQYNWTTWASQQEEELCLLREEEKEQLPFQSKSVPTASHNLPLLSRALQERRSQAAEDHLLALSDNCITVEPAEGEIWPNTTAHFNIVFKPEEAKLYQQTIYCDVTGRESRLPLTIEGEGIGPKLQLNYNLRDMNNVFIGDKDCYEVLVSNRGLIDAPFRLSSSNTTFGRCFSFSPEEGVVPSGACQIVEVTFRSCILGTFSEDLLLTVTGQPQPLTLTFRGCVIGPTFHFNVSELNFGDVAFGFPQTSICALFNTSMVPMTFALRVLGDGLGSASVTSAKQLSETFRNNWQGSAARDLHERPVEFTVSPAAGSVRAMSDVTIKVTLCSNTVKRYRLALVVDVEGVGEEIMTLPINARCVVPEIVVDTPVLDFQRCFLDHPYVRQVQLTNNSDLPACYGVLDQEYEESPSLLFGSSIPRGLIPPHSSEELPVFLLAKAVGRLHHTLRIAVFGSVQPPLEVVLSFIGQGPIVHVKSRQLDFGRIPVLTDVTRALHLSNQSPIPARFTARRSHRKSFWRVEPSEGEVPPEGQLELRVVAHLKDTLFFQDKLEVSIQDSQIHTIAVSATGTGTTIVSDRPFAPSLDLGTHFSHGSCQYHFKLTNHGQRVHRMYWKTDGFLPSTKTRKGEISSGQNFLPSISTARKRDIPGRGSLTSSPKDKPVFSLSPSRVELFPGCSVDMVLTGSSDSSKVVQEHLVCHGIVGHQGSSECIMSVDVTCRFVAPVLSISSKHLNFHIEKVPGKNLVPLYEKLLLKNVSPLSLSMELSLVEPFTLCEARGAYSPATTKSMILGIGKQVELWVCFNPAYCKDRMSHVVDEYLDVRYQGHPQQDTVDLHAEVHFPNLHFSSTTVDFGCVLNCTETRKELTITNCSLLPVFYRWAFLVDREHCATRDTEVNKLLLEEELEQENSINEIEERRGSPACSAALSPRPGAQKQNNTQCCVCVEEVFDVLPIYGQLQPGDQQLVTFYFYGHDFVSREAVALCQVEEGPTYEIKLRGKASAVSYSLDSAIVHFGPQLFDHVGEAKVILRNTGKVGFKFSIEQLQKEEEEEADEEAGGQRKVPEEDEQQPDARQEKDNEQNEAGQEVRPGQPVVIPTVGYVDADTEQCLRVLYLPGIPEVFEKQLQLEVAHLPPQVITLTGEGVFPRISLNLPRNLSEECYSDVVQQARTAVEAELMNKNTTGGGASTEATCTLTYEELLHMEIERTLVKENALALTSSLLELRDSQDSCRKWHKLSKFLLPEYVLDFGYAIPGKVLSHTVNVTNTGSVAVSFRANHKLLSGTGFSAEFERVKNLPCGETQTFTVKFDSQGANLQMGAISVVMPIQVTGGPAVQVQLSAVVTVPTVTVSTDTLQFGTVQCGMCQMETIQLFNHEPLPCNWSIVEEVKPFKKVDKFLPLYKRKKLLQEQRPPPVVFEVVPCSGMLFHGERVNVQVKFSPAEGCVYNRQLMVRVAEGTQQVVITAQGQGEEPQLEFCPSVLELGPCLPFSTEVEATVTVKNPCSFPVEFYSLEFDTQYLEEETILRLMQGYDENNILLLPPRLPGENLPPELLEYYKERCSQLKDDVLSEMAKDGNHGSLGQLEMTPVSRAIARHMGVDLSPEGMAARNRRGIAFIVYGAPLTGKSSTAAALGRHYGAACLSVDAVVTDVLINGTSPVCLTARQLYDSAAAEYAQRKAEEAAQVCEDTTAPGPAASLESTDPAPVEVLVEPSEGGCSRNDSKSRHEAENTHVALSMGVDATTLGNLLPEHLLADILADRLQLSDCHRGVVIDGLESVYTQSVANTLQVVLKALNNRKHIYVVNLLDSYTALKGRERAQREAEEALQKEKADKEEKWLQELDEEEYDALPEEEKERIAQRHREKLSKEADHSHKKTEETNGNQHTAESPPPVDKLERKMSVVDELQCQFSAYEQSRAQVEHILQHWDRAQGLLLVPLLNEESPPGTEDVSTEKHVQTPVGKRAKKASSKVLSPVPSQMAPPAEAEKPGDKASPPDIIPHIVLNVMSKDYPSATELLEGNTLPLLEEVLDDLGLGPNGPPIPPPITFSMVPFPQNRGQSNSQLTCNCFTFLGPSGPDEQGDEKKEDEEDGHASVIKEEVVATSKSRMKGSIKEVTKDKDKKSRESQRSKRRTSAKTKAKGSERSRSPLLHVSSMSDCTEQDQHQATLELKRNQRQEKHVILYRNDTTNGEVVLKIWFYTDSPGKFEQIFNFELLGTQKHYQLLCRGTCTYPSICKDYNRKVPQMEEGLQKTYIVRPGLFEFGPLLCSKTRDRYKENKYPENTERLVIKNNSGLEAEVQFCFQHDTQATTYLLDPPTMTLKPDQRQELTVWAYPTKVGQIKDSIVCCIKDNPELVTIHLSCWGVRPELELESKHLLFDRILLHIRDSRSVTLHNKTALSVSWRLQGVEELGDEFSVVQDEGIISPNSSFPLTLHFRARRPLHIKKILRLEVSDVEKILGIVHTENIQVTAEAYDIALDITPDGCLDFGTIKVFEEACLSLRMKNQGKYEIAYRFTLERTDLNQPKLDSIFTVSPESGILVPHKKPTTVQITCKPMTELSIREQPVLPCQVIEPSIGDGGETIAILTIKVSVQSVFSRYKIIPACDINFGPLVYGSKKSQSFTIENNGVFENHFNICCMITDTASPGRPGSAPSKKIPPENQSGRPNGAGSKVRGESFRKDTGITQHRLTMGVFSVSPCTGTLQPGSQQVVTVSCVAEQLGNWSQGLLIDISDRDPSDQPEGIPYRLLAEVCKPGIALDMLSIFEEHHVCHNSNQLSSEQFRNAEGIYVLDENKFIFNKVLVGRTAQARFKLTNNSKVPCVLSLAIKYVGAKLSRNLDVFDLPATTVSIPSLSHSFIAVTFTPQTMQLYSAVFEATLEGTSRMTPTLTSKVLEFDLIGEGSLPSVCVVRPALRNRGGSPMLQFRRVLVGRRHTLRLVLQNDGNVPAQVQIDMLDKHGVFALKAAPGNTCSSIQSTRLEGSVDSEHQLVHKATLRLDVNKEVEFEVSICSDKPLSVTAKMSLQVEGNQYSNTIIQVTGEAYQEIVSLDNISRTLQEMDQEDDEKGNYEVLNFGDCHVDRPYRESFTMINHSSSQPVRFEWPPAGPHVTFSPQVGHLHAGCSKEVTVTFCSSQPVTLTSQPIRCKVCQVQFQQPVEQVADWDDRQRTVQWLSASTQDSKEQPVKNKVIKTDPEPCCSVIEGSQWELKLHIDAVCDYVKFSCNTDTIRFKDTMLYQTRLHQLEIVNQCSVKLEFSWQVFMDPSSNSVNQNQGADGTLTSRPGSRSAGTLTGARPASALASVMSVLMGNPELPPFSVEPSIGAVEPGGVQNFTVCFSPLEVAQFQGRLLCSVPNLQDGEQAPCISLFGRSLLPHCHFDLEESDYITGNRRDPEFMDPLDPNVRVIEFNAVGFSAPKRCFSVVNPTSKTYSFKWRCEDTGGSLFHCLTPCGTILPGKKVEVCFEYVAEQLDVVESSWSFVIESLSLSVPFLCVGTCREPLVYLDIPHLYLGELLVGRKVEQTVDLVNGEEEPFHFSVLQSSLLCDDQQSSLILQPMTGTVASKDRLSLTVSFTPCREGFVSFRLVLRVKRKSQPLALTVKADCFIMSTSVQVESPDGGLREINPDALDTLDFGKVGISERVTFNILVSSLARFSLEVNFDLAGPSELLQHLEAKPQSATIEVGKQLQSSLFFCPGNICNLQDVKLSIKVKHGPTFTFDVKGRAVAPSLDFSFTKYNFGKRFLYCPGMVPASHTLVISNKGKRDISLQCQFSNNAYLEMDFQPDNLSPGATMDVPITFYPREPCRYHEKLTFILNGCVTKQVDILGQGIEMKLEVEDPRQQRVKLGSLLLGQKVKKQVVLVNRSPLDLSFTLLLNTNTPLDLGDLSFSPAGELNLKAGGGSCNVEIKFTPRQHLSPFKAELQAECAGLLHPLLTIQGCCQGVEVQLDQDYLAFGAVVQRCQANKRIIMMNTGDIGARFHWKTENFPPELSIAPTKGYICPGMEVPFEVTFAPVDLSNDTRYENLSCCVDGSSSPVTLTVTGSCIVASTSKEVVSFVCPVRCSHTQTLPVFNATNQRCNIRPVVEGEQWRAAPSLMLEPLQNETYAITYRPLTMTVDGKKHLGSVFFSFPDGTGMLYSLQGTAEPPKPEDTIVYELPAKTHHTEMLPVHNWLSKQQR